MSAPLILQAKARLAEIEREAKGLRAFLAAVETPVDATKATRGVRAGTIADRILRALDSKPNGMRLRQIVRRTRAKRDSVGKICRDMHRQGHLRNPSRGVYVAVTGRASR